MPLINKETQRIKDQETNKDVSTYEKNVINVY